MRARKDLVRTRMRLVQQLTAHLERAFPGAIGLFAELESPIATAFLTRFPSAERAAWLSPARFGTWLRRQGYGGRRTGAELQARLDAAPDGVSGPGTAALTAVTLGYVRAIAAVREQIAVLETRIAEQLAAHRDGAIFTSLPRGGGPLDAAVGPAPRGLLPLGL